jgi:hypothetical protein
MPPESGEPLEEPPEPRLEKRSEEPKRALAPPESNTSRRLRPFFMLVSLLLRPLPAFEPSERVSDRDESPEPGPPPEVLLPESRSEPRPLAMTKSNTGGLRKPTPFDMQIEDDSKPTFR